MSPRHLRVGFQRILYLGFPPSDSGWGYVVTREIITGTSCATISGRAGANLIFNLHRPQGITNRAADLQLLYSCVAVNLNSIAIIGKSRSSLHSHMLVTSFKSKFRNSNPNFRVQRIRYLERQGDLVSRFQKRKYGLL